MFARDEKLQNRLGWETTKGSRRALRCSLRGKGAQAHTPATGPPLLRPALTSAAAYRRRVRPPSLRVPAAHARPAPSRGGRRPGPWAPAPETLEAEACPALSPWQHDYTQLTRQGRNPPKLIFFQLPNYGGDLSYTPEYPGWWRHPSKAGLHHGGSQLSGPRQSARLGFRLARRDTSGSASSICTIFAPAAFSHRGFMAGLGTKQGRTTCCPLQRKLNPIWALENLWIQLVDSASICFLTPLIHE